MNTLRKRRRRALFLVTAGCLAPLVGLAIYLAWNNFLWPKTSEDEVRSALEARFQPGTPRSEIEAWLRTSGQGFDYVRDLKKEEDWDAGIPLTQAIGINPHSIGMTIQYSIKAGRKEVIIWVDVVVYMFFDKEDRLIKHYVTTEYTSF
jgi:hypothetical protein